MPVRAPPGGRVSLRRAPVSARDRDRCPAAIPFSDALIVDNVFPNGRGRGLLKRQTVCRVPAIIGLLITPGTIVPGVIAKAFVVQPGWTIRTRSNGTCREPMSSG